MMKSSGLQSLWSCFEAGVSFHLLHILFLERFLAPATNKAQKKGYKRHFRLKAGGLRGWQLHTSERETKV